MFFSVAIFAQFQNPCRGVGAESRFPKKWPYFPRYRDFPKEIAQHCREAAPFGARGVALGAEAWPSTVLVLLLSCSNPELQRPSHIYSLS